jgi:hypothetical protein
MSIKKISIRIIEEPIIGYGVTLPVYDDFHLPFPPTTVVFQDNAQGKEKTTPYILSERWRNYIQQINPPDSYQWMMNLGNMVINPPQPGDGTILCQSIMSGANYFAYNAKTTTHVRVVCFDHMSDPSNLISTIDRHWDNPFGFWKASAANINGQVINVGQGYDAYWPLMGHTPVWIHRDFVKLFPEGRNYHFANGAKEIWDGSQKLRGYENGQVVLPDPTWQINFTTFVPAQEAYP